MGTIRIEVSQSRWVESWHFSAGNTYDAPEHIARQLIKEGVATEVAPTKNKETAQAKSTGKETR